MDRRLNRLQYVETFTLTKSKIRSPVMNQLEVIDRLSDTRGRLLVAQLNTKSAVYCNYT